MGQSIERRWQRAQDYLAAGAPAPARALLDAMQAQAPDAVQTHLLASELAWRFGRVREATAEALAAFDVVPDDANLLWDTSQALLQVEQSAATRACLARPALAQATDPRWLLRVADMRQRLTENIESLALVERALAAGADDANVRFHYGMQLYFNGRLGDAEAAFDACLAVIPTHGEAALTRAVLRRQTADHNHVVQLDAGLAAVSPGSLDHAALHFARYKELEDLGRHEDAWTALAAGNAIMHVRCPFDANAVEVAEQVALAAPAGVADTRRQTEGDPQPIFIVGLPRSGTTLLDRMLGGHSQVRSAGELVDFDAQLRWAADMRNLGPGRFLTCVADLDMQELGRRYLEQTRWRAHDQPFFIDKLPSNWQRIGLILAALPGARILHLVRDPLDVCFSNWRALLDESFAYSYDLPTLGAYYRAYRHVMAHWRQARPGAVLDVPYADLVRTPESTMRTVLDYCDLAWESACAGVHGNATPVMTPSAAQVRDGIHTRGFGQWRPYAGQLQPLIDSLGDVLAPADAV